MAADDGGRCAYCGLPGDAEAHCSTAWGADHAFVAPAAPVVERCCEGTVKTTEINSPPVAIGPDETISLGATAEYVHAATCKARLQVHETVNTPENVNAAVRWARGTQMGEVLVAELVALRDTLAWSGRRAAEEQREIAALRAKLDKAKAALGKLASNDTGTHLRCIDIAARALAEVGE